MNMKMKRIVALLLTMVLLLRNAGISVFAAPGQGEETGLSNGTAQISLYQDGALGDAYVDGSDTVIGRTYTAGSMQAVIYNGLLNCDAEIRVDSFGKSIQDGINIFREVVNNNPDLFYVASSLTYSYSGNTLYAIKPWYAGTKNQISSMKKEFNAAVNLALEGIDSTMTPFEKALYLHDYIVRTNAYDEPANSAPKSAHSAYATLVTRTSVCDGYSLAYSYLLGKVGIESHIITGPGHAWNAIRLNGNLYFVDATWDDPVHDEGDNIGKVGHNYFLLTSSELKADGSSSHSSWEQNISCTDTTYSNAVYKNIDSSYAYYNGNWYYMDDSGDYNHKIMKTTDPLSVGSQYKYLGENYWWVYGLENSRYWPGYFGGLDIYQKTGELFYSTYDSVYSIDLDTGVETKEFTINTSVANGYLYGLLIFGDKLYAGVAQDPNTSEEIYYWDLDIPMIDFSFQYSRIELGKGGGYQATPIYTPTDANNIPAATWVSSNTGVATVTNSGFISAVAPGTTTITCTIGGISRSFVVEVLEFLPGDVNDDQAVDALDALDILKNVAGMITFTSKQVNIADVNKDDTPDALDALWILKKVAGML